MYENTVQERANGLIGTVYDWNGQGGPARPFDRRLDGRSSGFASRFASPATFDSFRHGRAGTDKPRMTCLSEIS